MNATSKTSPWAWIPTLYIAEGLPYFAVNVLTVIIYVQLGISNKEMAFYTGWLYLPWVIKPFWSPFVDLFATKRKWIIAMQAAIGISLACVAFFLPTGIFFASTLCIFWLMAFFSATHDIAADGYYILALNEKEQAAYVGVRSTFYRIASVIGQGGLVWLAGWLQTSGWTPSSSWTAVFYLLAILFAIIFFWHLYFLPRAQADRPAHDKGASEIAKGFADAFLTFFRKRHIGIALAFILLYRLPEALCQKMVAPFLIAPVNKGGLGMSVEEMGVANGIVGVVALLAGGIVGGLLVARGGLRKWLWPMALSLTLPCAFYLLLAIFPVSNFYLIAGAIGVEQFGYGFGFTAFMLYLMYFSRGKDSTSHYAFCTGFMALGMMLPGMAAGWLWEQLGKLSILSGTTTLNYINFFALVLLTSLVTFAVTGAVRNTLPVDTKIKR